jgi:hypothetical protein
MKEIKKPWWMIAIELLFTLALIGAVIAVLFNLATEIL